MNVFCTALGKTYTLSLNSDSTGAEILSQLEHSTGIPAHQFTISYESKIVI